MKKEEYIIGIHPIKEAIESGKKVERVLFRKGLEGQGFRTLLDLVNERGIAKQFLPIEALDRISRGNHQGVIAYLSLIEYLPMEELLERVAGKEAPLILLLDGVTDTGNFGAIARSVECAGADAIIIAERGSARITPQSIKASAGALMRVPIVRLPTIREGLFYLKQSGFKIISAGERGRESLYDISFKEPTAVVLGSEEKGVSRSVLQLSDSSFKIPMAGEIASLNVSAAAAVILFEALRQKSL